MTNVQKKVCQGCNKDKKFTDFYTADPIIFPLKFHICKVCIESIVEKQGFDNGFLPILRSMNKPFLSDMWAKQDGNYKKYVTQISSLPQYKGLTYDHSVFDENYIEKARKKQEKNEDSVFVDEDKIYSKKWLGYYTPSEIEHLDHYLMGLDRDFRVVTSSHRDYAKKIAKSSLYMDKCFQDMQNGVTGSEKKYKDSKDVFDTLSKSAQFSESQRGINDVGMGSISQIVEMVESETYVYEHKNDLDKDNYDKLIDDFQHIYKSL